MPHTRPREPLLPPVDTARLAERLESVRSALGASTLGVSRAASWATGDAGPSPFHLLAVVEREPSRLPEEQRLPLAGFARLIEGARPLCIDATSDGDGEEDALARWLRARDRGCLLGWPLPGDRLPSVFFLAHLAPDRDPGALRLRVALGGMEALARELAPPPWAVGVPARAETVASIDREFPGVPGSPAPVPGVPGSPAPTDTATAPGRGAGIRAPTDDALLRPRHPSEPLWGRTPAMVALRRRIAHLAKGSLPILLQAELGTEKEDVARAIHGLSAYRAGPFVVHRCGQETGSEAGAESAGELFDGERGVIASARDGVLLIDGIDALGLPYQTRLLRVLKRGVLETDGARTPLRLRLICATSIDLNRAVEAGRFLSELYWTLAVARLSLPPLRARRADIPDLLSGRLRARLGGQDPLSRFSEQGRVALMEGRWIGNMEQLEGEVGRLADIHLSGRSLDEGDLQRHREDEGLVCVSDLDQLMPLREATALVEELMIRRALRCSGGNKSEAARVLRLSRQGLYKKLRRYGLEGN